MRPLILLALALAADPAELTKLGPVEVRGGVAGDTDVSAAAAVGEFVVIAADSTAKLQLLAEDGDHFKVVRDIPLGPDGDEYDIEGVAADGRTVYAAGSHNRIRFIGEKGGGGVGKVVAFPPRDQVFRVTLDADGKPGPVEAMSLRKVLDAHPVLKDFVPVASKENGIDIEGLAVKEKRLYFGFRGPVLRDAWVPILSCTFDDAAGTAKTAYVQLGGRGVRDLVSVSDGFLVLAGPVGDGDGSYRLYHWDGKDGLTDGGKTTALADLPDLGRAKPEGLAVLKEAGKEYELLIVCDGPKDGAPTRWRLTRR